MKIFHFSDTHLWLTLENTSREEDFYTNFSFIFDKILEESPDVVVNTWDLFHTSKPSNKAISVVIENLLKLQKSGIPFLILAGNHDTPRLSTTTHPFEIFTHFENVFTFHLPEIKNIVLKNINFVALPHIHDENIFKQELQKSWEFLQPEKKNVFLSHFWLSGKEYDDYTDEISGVNISLEDIKNLKQYDYVGLGHYHKNFCIGNICYPWSIEHTSFNQKNYKNAYNIIDLSGEKTHISSIPLPTRPMIDFWEINVSTCKSTDDLCEFLQSKIDVSLVPNALVKIIFTHMSHELILEFDEKKLLSFFETAFYFEYKKLRFEEYSDASFRVQHSENIIYDNFEKFFITQNIQAEENIKTKIFQEIQNDLQQL